MTLPSPDYARDQGRRGHPADFRVSHPSASGSLSPDPQAVVVDETGRRPRYFGDTEARVIDGGRESSPGEDLAKQQRRLEASARWEIRTLARVVAADNDRRRYNLIRISTEADVSKVLITLAELREEHRKMMGGLMQPGPGTAA